MATRARVVRMEPPAATGGNALLVLVGLSVVFLLVVALLGVAKSGGSLISESNFLYVALIFYAGAGSLYMGFGVTGTPRYVRYASVATSIGLVANTLAVAHRWYLSGRPPFASIYEMLLSFVWAVAAMTLIAEKKFGVKIIGSITMPLAVVCVILMQLLPSEVRPLVPALQSTWLHVHVTLAMLSYAACALSCALAMMFLIKDNFETETFLAWTSAMVSAIYIGIIATRFERWGGLSVTGWNAQTKSDIFLGRGMRLFVTVPDLGWLFVIAAVAAIVPLILYFAGRFKNDGSFYGTANKAVFISILLQLVVVAAFVLRVRDAAYPAPRPGWTLPDQSGCQPVPTGGHGDGYFCFPVVPDAAVAAQRPPGSAALGRHARPRHLQDHLHRLPAADRHDCRRRLLGEPHLGLILELGPKGNLGRHHLAGLRGLSTYADHAGMARA